MSVNFTIYDVVSLANCFSKLNNGECCAQYLYTIPHSNSALSVAGSVRGFFFVAFRKIRFFIFVGFDRTVSFTSQNKNKTYILEMQNITGAA